jgi:hypothetical protein
METTSLDLFTKFHVPAIDQYVFFAAATDAALVGNTGAKNIQLIRCSYIRKIDVSA